MLSALDRLGTIAAVADELHLTAPGISMQLSALERELGLALTERHGRRLALTPAGRVLADHGHEILDRLALAEMEVDAIRGGELVDTGWRRLHRPQHPVCGGVSGRAQRHRACPPTPSGAIVGTACRGRYRLGRYAWLLERPAWSARRGSRPNRLPSSPSGWQSGPTIRLRVTTSIWPTWPITGGSRGSKPDLLFQMADRACGLAGFRPAIVAETVDFTVQLELVRAGIGVALVPHLAVAQLPAEVMLARPKQGLDRCGLQPGVPR